MGGRRITITLLVVSALLGGLVLPAFGQYPPPTPEPPSDRPGRPTDRPTGPPSEPPGKPGDRPPGQTSASASCSTQPDGTQIIITCLATGFEPGSTVLYEFFGSSTSAGAIGAGGLAQSSLLTKGVTTADATGQAAASTAVECGSLTGFRGVFTGVDESGGPLELSATVDDESLGCGLPSGGVFGLATTGQDALWLLALGLVLLAAGGQVVERSRRRRVTSTV